MGPPGSKSCWDAAAAAAVSQKLTFWPGNYNWSFQAGSGLIWELSGLGDRLSTQFFDARLAGIVVWPGEPSFEKFPNRPYIQK